MSTSIDQTTSATWYTPPHHFLVFSLLLSVLFSHLPYIWVEHKINAGEKTFFFYSTPQEWERGTSCHYTRTERSSTNIVTQWRSDPPTHQSLCRSPAPTLTHSLGSQLSPTTNTIKKPYVWDFLYVCIYS